MLKNILIGISESTNGKIKIDLARKVETNPD